MLTRKTTRRLTTALTAALLLASALSTASARNLSIVNANQNFRVTWSNLEFQAEAATIRCPVTLEGSFHRRTIAKVARSLIGAITEARSQNERGCTNGILAAFNGRERYNGTTTPNTLPWHLTYEAFVGRLPAIEAIILLLQRFRFGINFGGGLGCTAQLGASTDNISYTAAREARGGITSLTPIAGRNIYSVIREDGDPFNQCPRTLNFVGASTTVTLLNSAARITITLI